MNIPQRLQRAWQETPIFFLVAPLFYLFLVVLHGVNYAGAYDLPVFWITLAGLLALLVCSVGLVGLRRWAGLGFVAVVAVRLILAFTLARGEHADADHPLAAFPMEMLPDIVFSALVLFFYKQLR